MYRADATSIRTTGWTTQQRVPFVQSRRSRYQGDPMSTAVRRGNPPGPPMDLSISLACATSRRGVAPLGAAPFHASGNEDAAAALGVIQQSAPADAGGYIDR